MCEQIKVSIIMPVYNAERYLPEAIESVIGQTYQNWELIAVDDCSADHSREILGKYASEDSRVRPIFMRTNSGAAAARNVAIKNADGKYMAFLDSDDIWLREKLEVQVNAMQKGNQAFSFTSYGFIDESGHSLNRKVAVPATITYKQALTMTTIWTSSVMLDVCQIGEVEMPMIRSGQDVATWLKVLKNIPCAHGIDQVLSMYRQVSTSLSHQLRNRLFRMWDVYRISEQFSFMKSLGLCCRHVLYVLKRDRECGQG